MEGREITSKSRNWDVRTAILSGDAAQRGVLVTGLLAGACLIGLGLGYAIAGDRLSLTIPALAAAPWLLWLVFVDWTRLSHGRPPLLVGALILLLPFLHLGFVGTRWTVMIQATIALVAVLYLLPLSPRARSLAFRRVRWVVIPFGVLSGLLILSYAASPRVTRVDIYAAFNFATSLGMALLVGVCCTDWRSWRRLVVLLVFAGALQAPLVLAQAYGYASRLPAGLAQLSPAIWGGALNLSGSSSVLARYPGSFGDYELLAECCGLLVVLTAGGLVFGLFGRWRTSMAVACACVAVTGWYTGSRAFLLATAGACLLLAGVALLQSGSRGRRLSRMAGLVALLAFAVVVLVPDQVRTGVLGRFATATYSGPSAFNRAEFYAAGFDLIRRMPVLGFGTSMMSIFDAKMGAIYESPHSLYLTVVLTTGFGGLAALLALFAATLSSVTMAAIRSGAPAARHWAGVFLAALVYFIANEAKIDFVRIPFYVDYVVVFLALAVCLPHLSFPTRDSSPAGSEAERRRR